jgi:predicted permease
MEMLLQDLRYGVRMLMRRRGFMAIAILALALGVGANTAIFSVVNAVLLRPLPFKDPGRLVFIHETVHRETVERRPASYPDFEDWRDQNQVFEQIAAYADGQRFTLTGAGTADRIAGELVSASYFPLLGAQAARGRTFLAEEDRAADPQSVAVISHALWQQRFGADPNLLGQTIKLDDQDCVVVGIMPEGFKGVSSEAQIWIPMASLAADRSSKVLQQRGSRWHQAIARLKPGVTLAEAQADMDAIAARISASNPRTNDKRGVLLVGARDDLFGDIRPALLVLLAAVGFVLLIACANVANLLLARAASRQKEIAIRTALGAGRLRLIRQFLTESVLLGLLGGACGLLLAVWGIDLLVALIPVQIPGFVKINMDASVLGFTLLISFLTGLAFGLAPALQASKLDLNETLKDGSRGSTGGAGHNRIRRLLVIAEIALALVLLVGAGLMLKSFERLRAFNPGFKTDHVLTVRANLSTRKYKPDAAAAFSERLVERIGNLPSVEAVGVGSDLPLDGSSSATLGAIEGSAPGTAENEIRMYHHRVSPNFFATLGIPLITGRNFTPQDDGQAPPVVIISETMARRYWADENPLGKRITIREDKDGKPIWDQIVGVVGDVKYRTLIRDQNKDPDIYLSFLQLPRLEFGVAVRTSLDPAALATTLRTEMQNLDPDLPISEIATMEQRLKDETAQSRFTTLLLGIFAFVAIVLAGVGIYGVMSYSVTLRTHEIGIRMALGAKQGDILRLVVGEGMALVGTGIVIGLTGAMMATRVLAAQLYSVSATDPATFVIVPLILAGVALAACFVPARRATKVDPMVALRYE